MSFVRSKQQQITISSAGQSVELTSVEGFGVFQVYVEEAKNPQDGSSGTFSIAANKMECKIQPMVIRGLDGELIDITWQKGGRPQFRLTGRVNQEFLPKTYLVFVGYIGLST